MSTCTPETPTPRVLQFADRLDGRFALWSGPLMAPIHARLDAFGQDGFVDALYARTPALWSGDAGVQAKIANRLGWMTSPEWIVPFLPRITRFADEVRQSGVRDVVLLGMGGSSLAPEVIRSVMGVKEGWPAFHMLDSTDPASVLAVDAAIDLTRTIFILASKSGGTIEPNSMAAHFRARLEDARVGRWADHFVAITDEGTALHQRATADRYREIFVNPSDIGGRYSAVSFFGLVPAALMGHDAGASVDWARAMLWICGPGRPLGTNPAVLLGAAMAIGAQHGRDKLTLQTPPALTAFGLWVEQLVAESTGKSGKGVVPVVGESLGRLDEYGRDRVMVHLAYAGQQHPEAIDALRRLAANETPLIQIDLPEPEALGAEFVRWELATAVACVILGVNPFDEPNVQQAKDATKRLLEVHAREGRVPCPDGSLTVGGQPAAVSAAAKAALGGRPPDAFLSLLGAGDYLAVLAYLGPDVRLLAPLTRLRADVRARSRAATTVGYGPRYLHSTGQLHKGGADNGVFLVLSATATEDVPVPGEPFSFGVLELAQASGDFMSLDAAGRRALHVHLNRPDPRLIEEVCAALLAGI
ncbi:MAG: glucose-6-phosphate isomerase [Acidobacteria bacterium]|nr:glucose-6-phosphate isomerase [Acidobacteriota bacterium]